MHHIKPLIIKPDKTKRQGKGFSPDEIKQAGMNAAEAKKLGIPVDWKRKTCHEENVEALKSHKPKLQAASKHKSAAKPKASKKKSKS